jgi:hypothetical protein
MAVGAVVVIIVVEVAIVVVVDMVVEVVVIVMIWIVVVVVVVVLVVVMVVIHVIVVVMVRVVVIAVIEWPLVVEVATVILVSIAVVEASTTTSTIGPVEVVVVVMVRVVAILSRAGISSRSRFCERSISLAFPCLSARVCAVTLGSNSAGGCGNRGFELCALVGFVLLSVRVSSSIISCRSRGLGISLHSERAALAWFRSLLSGYVSFDILIGRGLLLIRLNRGVCVGWLSHHGISFLGLINLSWFWHRFGSRRF